MDDAEGARRRLRGRAPPGGALPRDGGRLAGPFRLPGFRLPDFRLPTSDSRLPTPDSRLPTPDVRGRQARRRLTRVRLQGATASGGPFSSTMLPSGSNR
ncbi:hypothetical protein CWD88_03190 [Burkholderia pseudomallei]|uniref:Uncharacterized protein n=1 Tax=Burkholderia pseudomallei TaxID=28450 RepID=A0AAX0UGG1_BURPE|nr:hypothetical protein CWD88_03190 [Burkholderia pseudomallei]